MAVETIKNAAGTVRPILEISHDLWTQYRKREGQSLDQFISRDVGGPLAPSRPETWLPLNTGSAREDVSFVYSYEVE